ncbi:type II secretion system secretin GspD [Rhodanobacter sp. DHG33]|uniref:type II secretion system secretin GspD n=1 Tax=Rhodanobacter sp. DHG33 TaxID=2775921 RepID=UPI00178712DD|nr:type II secretion system secretin GspD [Rhodanobacter sp. DHG33]MBD8897769.1 type II secretion system secretin GspD [Rhodanobacter sp. DHG33]
MSRQHTSEHSRPPVRFRRTLLRAAALSALTLLAGCAGMQPQPDDPSLQREAMAGTHAPVPAPLPLDNEQNTATGTIGQPQVSRGSGQFVHATGLATPRPSAAGPNGVVYNFENQPVQAVVKAILGDQLKLNYTIVPGVQGNISFSTSEPVDAKQALPILETLLSWTNNALVERSGSYVVLPAKDAVGGNLVPSLGAAAPSGGLQARLFPLHYIAAAEMQKLIKPFARPDAVLLVDSARNVIVMSGTPEDLDNYQRTVSTFDVDWLRGMSVGVFNLQNADVDQLMPKLDEMFGSKGDTPLAGMVRFIPIKRTNALVVISTQPRYVDEVGDWISRIDQGGGNQPQLFVYNVRNMKASDLAKYLGQIYGSSTGGGSGGGEVGPGLSSGTLGSSDNARGSASGMGSTAGSFGSSNTATGGLGGMNGGGFGGTSGALGGTGGIGSNGSMSNGMTGGAASGSTFGTANAGSQDQQYTSQDGSIHISSVDANNQLLVRARPSQWNEIETAIKRLDNVPLQVQIETRILEVDLTGQFQFGVQWYLQGLANSTPTGTGFNDNGATSIYPGAHRQIALGQGTNGYGGQPFFYSFLSSNGKFQVAINALEQNGNTKTLSAPSLVVLNNQVAHIEVGNQIPVNQTSIVAGLTTGTGTNATANSVTYLPTGVILNVQPRVNPGGLVYLDIDQQVSSTQGAANSQGNYTIAQREIGTQVAVQSGQTVLLGGLIQDERDNTDTGIPGLNRVPILGRLFGSTSHTRNRTELIVLITPRVIRDSEEARQITDDYQQGFESLKPLYTAPAARATNTSATQAAPAQTVPLQH